MSRTLGLSFVALLVTAACAGQGGTPSSAPATAAVTAAASQAPSAAVATQRVTSAPTAGTPTTFTSLLYGYSITLPAGWSSGTAMLRWDGASSPGHDDGSVDKFASPATVSTFAFAGPVKGDIDKFVEDNIAWTVRDHGDTCPATAPEKKEPIQIGGRTGVLLSWDCGILINDALVVRDGTGFVFVMRDPGVPAATDATDRALFEELLDSVTFPT